VGRYFKDYWGMNKHDITNKMAAAIAHLRMADTLCASPRVIDELREATRICLEVGEACGKTLTRRS
jgi:hypothetical protein